MWKCIRIKDKDFAISARKGKKDWTIYATDFVGLWNEKLETETIVKRCKELNPLLKIEGLNVDHIMEEILTDIPQFAVEKSEISENCKIMLHKDIQGGRFKFELNLSKENDEEFSKVIIKLISFASMTLFRKYSVLLKIIKQKDEEIAEYKAEGATLIRKNIETKPFTEDLLKLEQDFSSMNTFQSMVKLCNEAQKLNLEKNPITCKNSKRSNESLEEKDEAGKLSNDVPHSNKKIAISDSNNLPRKIELRESLKYKQKEKNLKAKKAKGIISASFTKPIKKEKSRITNFIS